MMKNTRAIAASCLEHVLYQHKALSIPTMHNSKDRAFVQACCFGVLRHREYCDAIANILLNTPIKAKEGIVHCLLLVGIYQILMTEVPHYAAVSETVSATRLLKKNWASGLINKVLKRLATDKSSIIKALPKTAPVLYSHPAWLVNRIKKAWPTEAENIFSANNSQPPMTLRINKTLTTTDAYLKELKQLDINADTLNIAPSAIQLAKAVPVSLLPSFEKGYCYLQDITGQLINQIITPGKRTLDACAAPGSKSTGLLEQWGDAINLVALDIDESRLSKVKDNITRLQLNQTNVTCMVGDACAPNTWWDKKHFDTILCDAPCSATGVIRRHPDIKYLRRHDDIATLAKQQLALLSSLWNQLAQGGQLLYTTCSILPDENEAVIAAFLSTHADAHTVPLSFTIGSTQKHGWQVLPEKNGPDGFYYALIKKSQQPLA